MKCDLAHAGIDGNHPSGAVLQQAVGETSSGRAYIKAEAAADIDLPVLQRVFEFQPAAAYVFQIIAEQSNFGRGVDRRSRLFNFLFVDQYFSGEYQRLRAFPRRNEATLEQQLIKA